MSLGSPAPSAPHPGVSGRPLLTAPVPWTLVPTATVSPSGSFHNPRPRVSAVTSVCRGWSKASRHLGAFCETISASEVMLTISASRSEGWGAKRMGERGGNCPEPTGDPTWLCPSLTLSWDHAFLPWHFFWPKYTKVSLLKGAHSWKTGRKEVMWLSAQFSGIQNLN